MKKPALEDMDANERAVYLATRGNLEKLALKALRENEALRKELAEILEINYGLLKNAGII